MSNDDSASSRETFVWRGVLDPAHLHDHIVALSHRFADAAKVGDWSVVLQMLNDPTQQIDVNWWRPGGTAWFTVLHQAAWHGAPVSVVASLIQHGALRTLPESRGRTAYDVFMDCAGDIYPSTAVGIDVRSRTVLERLLTPPAPTLGRDDIRALDNHLAEVIDGRISELYARRNPREVLRYPPVDILHEVPDQHIWFPVPGMYGGFDIRLQDDFLDVKSWCRVVGGSGQEHVITTAGAILVDEGFI